MSERHPVTKIVDERFHFRNLATSGEAVTRVRIYDSEPPTIIASELDDNPGASITNMAEFMWPEIIKRYLPHRMEFTPPALFLEHYVGLHAYGRHGRDEYTQVHFDLATPRVVWQGRTQRLSYGEPTWRHMSIDDVTSLVGHNPSDEKGGDHAVRS